MSKVRVMTAKDYSDETLKTLHKAGVLHVEESEELEPVDREAIERERREVFELLTSIDDVLAYIPKGERVHLGGDVEVIYTRPLNEIDAETRSLCTKLGNMHQQGARLEEEAEGLKETKRYLEPFSQRTDIRLSDLNFSGAYLFSRVFALSSETYGAVYSRLENYLLESIVATAENETLVWAIARIEDQASTESAVKDAGGKIIAIPAEDLTPREFLEVAEDKIRSLEEELSKINGEIESKTRENLDRLVLLREALLAENERLSVLQKACEAKYVTLFEGWIPGSNVESTTAELKENVDYVFVDAREPEQAEEPPTKLRNPTGFKPFEIVVNLFGIPKYREWDPTPVIAYSFAFFFGLMLADVVYAAFILLAARFVLPRLTDDPQAEGTKLFQRLLYISSGFGLVMGLLTGTYLGNFYAFFGIESLALSRGIAGIFEDALYFIVFALVIGLIHVNIAHVLALIKGIKRGQKFVVPARLGLFLLQIAGIPWIVHFLFGIDLPVLTAQMYSVLLYIMALAIILIVIASFMERGAFLGGIFWLFDITGLLGDVMSYCRLAGVGLATYYLAFCFNLMGPLLRDMIPAGPGGVLQLVLGSLAFVLVLFVGHAINLLLAGISCFVHSLRLCFVEFLFKFYEGGGREYSPFRLRKRTLVAVKGGA
jgi:V/A-type H+-transporting ATPase subunit I